MPPGRKTSPTFKDSRSAPSYPSRPEAYARGARIGTGKAPRKLTFTDENGTVVSGTILRNNGPMMVYGDKNIANTPGMGNKPQGRPKRGGSGIPGGNFLKPGYSPKRAPRAPKAYPRRGGELIDIGGIIIEVPSSPAKKMPAKSAPKTTKRPTKANVRRK